MNWVLKQLKEMNSSVIKILQAIVFAFSGKARNKAIAYFIGLFVVFSVPTALLSNPIIPYVRMIPATWLDYFFLLATSALAAVFLALPENKTCSPNKTAFAGGFFGFVSFACPICNHLFVSLIGFAFLYNVVNPLRPLIGIVSIVILAYGIGKKWMGISLH